MSNASILGPARDRRCVRCGRPAESWHHRVAEGRGGPTDPWNCVPLCGSGTTGCHGWVEHHREAARAAFLLIPGYFERGRYVGPDDGYRWHYGFEWWDGEDWRAADRGLGREVAARFWAKVRRSDGCWIWVASEDGRGYGQFAVSKGEVRKAHRVAVILDGRDPEGSDVHHRCGETLCVRPDHLAILSSEEHRAEHPPPTVCRRGHALVPENLYRRGRDQVCRRCHLDRQHAYRERARA